MNKSINITNEAVNFFTTCNIDNFHSDIIHMSKRCFMDGLAVIIAGTEQPALKIMEDMLTRLDYPHESR